MKTFHLRNVLKTKVNKKLLDFLDMVKRMVSGGLHLMMLNSAGVVGTKRSLFKSLTSRLYDNRHDRVTVANIRHLT